MESLSNHFRGLRAIVSRHTRAYPPFIISFLLQSRRSDPSSFSFSVFRAIFILNFGIQSHQHFQFEVQSQHRSQHRCSEPSVFLVWRLEPSSFSVSAFRAIIVLIFGIQSHHRYHFRRSKPPSLLSFSVQSHHHSQFWHSEPSSLLSFGIQSHQHS